MSETNPWKQMAKQQQANNTNPWKAAQLQNKTDTNRSPPSWLQKKQQAKGNSPSPSWVKKKQQSPPSNNPNSNTVSWAKHNNNNPINTNNTPSWVKNNTGNTGNAPWAKNNQTNPWKAQQERKVQEQLEKKKNQQERLRIQVEEEKLKKEAEEQQERQRKEAEQAQKVKIKEQENQKRQSKMMELQEKHSKERELYEKQKQTKGKGKNKHPGKSAGKSNVKSPQRKVQIAQIPAQSNKFIHYLSLFQSSTSRILDYPAKISYQQHLLNQREQLESEFSKIIQQSLPKIQNRNRKHIIHYNQIEIQYGLCYGTKIEQKVNFDWNQMEALHEKWNLYNKLQDVIIKIKKHNYFRIRVPCMVYCMYKNMHFIGEYKCSILEKAILAEVENYPELKNQLNLLENQLKQMKINLKLSNISLKKINLNNQNYYIAYITNWTLNHEDLKSTSSSIILLHHLQQLTTFRYVHKDVYHNYLQMSTPKIQSIINCIYLAQTLSTVHASCQGEIDDNAFWRLVLEGNEAMWKMIRDAGYQGDKDIKGIVFKYFQAFSGITLKVKRDTLQRKKVYIKSYTKIWGYSYSGMQLLQFCNNTEKYLGDNKLKLAEQSLRMSKSITKLRSIKIIKEQINIYLYHKQYENAVKLIQTQSNKEDKLSFKQIFYKLQQITIYILQQNQSQLLNTFRKLLELLQFYYNQDNFIHSLIYTVIGCYYSKRNSADAMKFLQIALSLGRACFGEKSIEVASIYHKRAQIKWNSGDYKAAEKDASTALNGFKCSSKHHAQVAQVYFLLGKIKQSTNDKKESEHYIKQAIRITEKLELYNQQLAILHYKYSKIQDEMKQEILQQIIKIALKSNNTKILSITIKSILQNQLKNYPIVTFQSLESICQISDEEQVSESQTIMQFSNLINTFNRVIDMIKWSLMVLFVKKDSHDYNRAVQVMTIIVTVIRDNQNVEVGNQIKFLAEKIDQKSSVYSYDSPIKSEDSPIKSEKSSKIRFINQNNI